MLQVSTPDEFAPGVDALDGMLLLRLKSEPLPGHDACEPYQINLPYIDRSKCDGNQYVHMSIEPEPELYSYAAEMQYEPEPAHEPAVPVRLPPLAPSASAPALTWRSSI